jgi:hypothetical protein
MTLKLSSSMQSVSLVKTLRCTFVKRILLGFVNIVNTDSMETLEGLGSEFSVEAAKLLIECATGADMHVDSHTCADLAMDILTDVLLEDDSEPETWSVQRFLDMCERVSVLCSGQLAVNAVNIDCIPSVCMSGI